MKYCYSFFLILVYASVFGQNENDQALKEIEDHRKKQRKEFLDPEKSPLEPKELRKFVDLEYFPVDLKYRVKAKFREHDAKKFFRMKTTTDRTPEYVRFGELTFEIAGQPYALQVYQNQGDLTDQQYEDYLFLPFNDDTNGLESYGGGRYIDFRIPDSDEVTLDFNKAYNPYCCYSGKYSCPIPPQENYLPVKILAGVKDYKNGKKKK